MKSYKGVATILTGQESRRLACYRQRGEAPGGRLKKSPERRPWEIEGEVTIKEALTLTPCAAKAPARQGHQYTAYRHDGRQQVLLNVPKFDFNWQLHTSGRALRVRSSRIIAVLTTTTRSNRYNPAPIKRYIGASRAGMNVIPCSSTR